MLYPSTILIDDTDTTDNSNLSGSLGNIYGYGRLSAFLSVGNAFSITSPLLITINAHYNSTLQPDDPSYLRGSSFTLVEDDLTILSGSMSIPRDSLNGRFLINIGPSYSGSYDSVDGNNYYSNQTSSLFHELTHAMILTSPGSSIPLTGFTNQQYFFAEQLSVFATNAGLSKQVSDPERVGHTGGELTGATSPQTSYISISDSIMFSWDSGNALFRTEDGRAGQTASDPGVGSTVRTYYYNPVFEGIAARNYVTVERDTGLSGSAVFGGNGSLVDSKTAALINQSIVAGGQNSVYRAYDIAGNAMLSAAQIVTRITETSPGFNQSFSLASNNQGRTVMVANERYADSRGNDAIDDTGPVQASDGSALAKFYIIDTASNKNTFLLGGGTTTPDILKSGSGNDVIAVGTYVGSLFNEAWGGAGSDILIGRNGKDRLEGGAGNDILVSNGGADWISGGSSSTGDPEFDALILNMTSGAIIDMNAAVQGTAGAALGMKIEGIEAIYATPYDDQITLAANMYVLGNGGNDRFTMASGAWARGGLNNDAFVVSTDMLNVTVRGDGGTGVGGGMGVDTVTFAGFYDTTMNVDTGVSGMGSIKEIEIFYGGGGKDVFTAITSVGTTLYGNGGNDTFTIGAQTTVYGGWGDDTINLTTVAHAPIDGENGNDTVNFVGLTSGVTFVTTGNGFTSIEVFNTTGYADVVTHDSMGTVAISTGGGNDIIYANGGAAAMDGGAGFDTVSYANSFNAVTISGAFGQAGAAGDTYTGIEKIIGSSLADTFRGGVSEFWGGGGNDIFVPSGAGGTFYGEGGTDIIDFSGLNAGITFNLGSGNVGGQLFYGVERVNGTAFVDRITGTAASESFFGGRGGDIITGGGGAGFDRYFVDADKTVNDGDGDIMRVRKLFDPGGTSYFAVDITYNGGWSYETDILYGMSAMTMSDGTDFAFPAYAWYNPFYS